MSDYFSQLVERSLGSAVVAQPRVAAFYEPPKTAPSSKFSEQPDFGVTDSLTSRSPLSEALLPQSNELLFPANRHASGDQSLPSLRESQREATAPQRTLPVGIQFSEPSTEREPVRSEMRRETYTATPDSPVAKDNIVAADIGKKLQAEGRPVPRTNASQTPDQAPGDEGLKTMVSLSGANYQEVRTHPLSPHVEIAANLRALSALSKLRRRAPTSVDSKKSAQTESDDLRAQLVEPTIHVTIGRVEVRATIAQAPKRKEPAATPVMSLEDYLRKQRSGVGR